MAALALAVTLAHLELAGRWLPARLGDGAADGRPRRIEVALVRELLPAEPVAVSAPPVPRKRLARSLPGPAAAASAVADDPLVSGLVPLPVDDGAALASTDAGALSDQPLPAILELPPEPLVLAASAPDPAASEPTRFDWPPSTRLSYVLSGDYRGPVHGQAQVEWLRDGPRYQVRVEVSVGPAFAPLMSRIAISSGEIGPDGLYPLRYDEETRFALREPRRTRIVLDPDRVNLPGGAVVERPAGVQDSASQFVQLTWMFTLRPELLHNGRSVELPLALPRAVQPWTYEVIGPETLDTPVGRVDTVHVKPRREARPGGDLVAEIWVAPRLQYLPVRMLIRQDAQTYIDLLVDRLPLQAEAGR